MFYVAAQENKNRQILRIKSQVSKMLTNKYNSADLSLKLFQKRVAKGGGVTITHHVEFSIESCIKGNFFLSNHASRIKE